MEKETHVDSTSSGEQADICQILFDIVEDQSDVHGRAVKETAILLILVQEICFMISIIVV